MRNLPTTPSSLLRLNRRGQWGQAMLEYSTVSLHMLMFVGGFGILKFGPMFLNGMQKYLDGIYYVLNAPLP